MARHGWGQAVDVPRALIPLIAAATSASAGISTNPNPLNSAENLSFTASADSTPPDGSNA